MRLRIFPGVILPPFALLASILVSAPSGGSVPDSLRPPEGFAADRWPWDRTGKWMMIGGGVAALAVAPFWALAEGIENGKLDAEDWKRCHNQDDSVACKAQPHQMSEGPQILAWTGAAVFATGLLIRIFSPDDPSPSARLEWEPRRGGMAARAVVRF